MEERRRLSEASSIASEELENLLDSVLAFSIHESALPVSDYEEYDVNVNDSTSSSIVDLVESSSESEHEWAIPATQSVLKKGEISDLITISSESPSHLKRAVPSLVHIISPDMLLPTTSSSRPQPPCKPKAAIPFSKQRSALTKELFHRYNQQVFENKLPADLDIAWNPRLTKTAGLTHYKRVLPIAGPPQNTARVELSTKVLDSKEKLERTLCHELCHVAAWLVHNTAKPPHGPVFKAWAQKAESILPGMQVSTCHDYSIWEPFKWQCTVCLQEYGRHSNSIRIDRQVCGTCKGPLQYLGKFKQDGTPMKQRAPSSYSKFVSENFASVKADMNPDASHGNVMKELATMWRDRQATPGLHVGAQSLIINVDDDTRTIIS